MTRVDHAIHGELRCTEPCAPAEWLTRVRSAAEAGWQFAGLHGARDGEHGARLRAAFERDGQLLLLACCADDARFPSLVADLPAAQWDEREAHDLHGIQFDGHEPLRPLVSHPDDLAAWTTPVHGRDPYQVAVGPIHAGVIESGHFRFHVVGERILHLDLRLFYKHRGLQQAAADRPATEALRYAQRACGACAVTNTIAFAHAYEAARGLWPQPELRRARTLLLELERLYNHLNDLAAVCAGVGFAAGNMAFAALKERVHRLNQQLAGHRFLFDTVTLGRSELAIGHAATRAAAAELTTIRDAFATSWRQLQFAHTVQERFAGLGALDHHDARTLGAVGPTARASGVRGDVREHSPRLWYGNGFHAAAPTETTGDVTARVEMRAAELNTTFALLDQLLARPLTPAVTEPARSAGTLGASLVESPRGATLCVLELRDDDTVVDVRLRTGSYANWPALAHVVPGNPLPDFPLLNKSFELCYACADR